METIAIVRASIHSKHYTNSSYFDTLEDAQEYLIANIDGYTEDPFLLGISLEVFQGSEWVNTAFNLNDAKSILAITTHPDID